MRRIGPLRVTLAVLYAGLLGAQTHAPLGLSLFAKAPS